MPRLQLATLKYMLLLSGCVIALLAGCSQVGIPVAAETPGPTSTASPPSEDPAGPSIYNVKLGPYNAKGDGITDDTLAIRSAIAAACDAGGGEVYLPKGTYIVSPQAPAELGAVIVPCDNITIAGAGMGISIISRKTLADTDPDLTCPITQGQVNRGAGIYVTPKLDGDKVRHAFHLSTLSVVGNRLQYTGMHGSNLFPATPANCLNVWDTSDKGVYVQQDHDSEDVELSSVEIAYFSGELLYGGSQKSTNWIVRGSNFHHSNGDAISFGAGAIITGSTLHDLAANGLENQLYGPAESQSILSNTVYNIALDGIAVMTYSPSFYSASPPTIEIASNTVTQAQRFGIVLLSTRSGNIHDNAVYDSGIPAGTACGIALVGLRIAGVLETPQNIGIVNNVVEARAVGTKCGIEVDTAANINLQGNHIGPAPSSGNSIVVKLPFALATDITNLTMTGNVIK